MSIIIHSEEREKELQKLCESVLEASPNKYYNPNGPDTITCPFCYAEEYSKDCNDYIDDINHELDCAYLIAKDLSTNQNHK